MCSQEATLPGHIHLLLFQCEHQLCKVLAAVDTISFTTKPEALLNIAK